MANFDSVHHLVNDMKYCTNKLLLNGFETLEIDNIIDSKISKDQKRHYLVCFKSWLPEDHLNNYTDLIEEYWRKREEDDKKWKGSQDGESDKENNFMSPTSSKSKRSFVFPSQTQPASELPDNDKIKFTDNHNSNGLDITGLPLDLPDTSIIKAEDASDVDEEEEEEEEEEESFELSIDESNGHTITTPVFNESKTDTFVDRLINSGSSPPTHSSSRDEDSYNNQSISYTGPVSMYNGGSDETDENSIDYLVKPSIQTVCDPPTSHLQTSFNLSNNETVCVNTHRANLEEIPIVDPICDEELPGFDNKRERGELINGERHIDEYDETTCEDGRLSLYDDEQIDEEPIDEFDETLIDEDGEDSDVSEFGVDESHSGEIFDRNDDKEMNGDRTSSDYSDTTPENIQLNKFTPLNTVQINKERRFTPPRTICTPTHGDMHSSNFKDESNRQVIDNEGDFPDHRTTPTSNYDDQGIHTTHVSHTTSDISINSSNEQPKTLNLLPERPIKKRKGKTLDDIVRKISSANEQAAEKKTFITDEDDNEIKNEKNSSWGNGDANKFIKKEILGNDNEAVTIEHSQPDADKPSSTHDGNRENNVYWSAGKAFHKRNISYKCKFCEHRFDDETLLKDHERSHGQHQCRNCSEVFLTSTALFEHREVAHAFKPRQRYNKCRFCPTLYADPAMLQRHEEIHHLSRSPVTPGHGEDPMNDLPPPLVSIDESQRKFPRYENHRDLNRNDQGYRPRSPRELKPGRSSNEPDPYERREVKMDDEEGKSIVRNPIRNLLGKMYQTQKKLEHGGGGDRFPHRFSGYRSKLPPPAHQFHYADYPRCYSVPQSRTSPEHPQREVREYRHDMRGENTPVAEEDTKGFRELVHICRICNKSFGMKDNLEQHWLTAHADTPTFSCEVCHEIFIDKEDLDSHMSIHLKQDYYCGYCRKTFDCRANYESHMRAHSNDRPFTCHICGRAFSLRTNLRRHILIHTDITPYRCHVCFKGFRRSDMLSSHIKQYHVGRNEEKCQKFETNDPAYSSERRSEEQTASDSVSPVFQPPSGGNSPYTPRHDNNNINGHNESFNNVSPNHHNDDTKVYPIESRMKHSPDSIPMKHSPNSPRMHHSPSVSSRHESGDVTLLNHSSNMVQINHLPSVVGMHHGPNEHNFHRPNGMLTPMGSDRPPHQLVAPIPVMKQARFSPYKTNLVNILPLPVTSSRMECNECGEKFTSESLYEIHMQSHVKEASYTCRKCRRTFSGKSQYNSHMQTHENNKSHSCPYCHRSFSMKGNLRRHIRIHTNEAPYECPICFQRFRRSDGLKGHIKRHDAMGESAPGDMVPSQAST